MKSFNQALFICLSLISISVNAATKPTVKAVDKKPKLETATLAAGCFWGTEEFFRKIPGVTKTKVGYTGGSDSEVTYEKVSEGTTGNAESVEIEFDPSKVTYRNLLISFFKMHDPTTLNRQGNDRGTQYRSAIFYHGLDQKKVAEEIAAKASVAWKAPVTTEIKEAKAFHPAEEYHQKFLVKNPGGYDNHKLYPLSIE